MYQISRWIDFSIWLSQEGDKHVVNDLNCFDGYDAVQNHYCGATYLEPLFIFVVDNAGASEQTAAVSMDKTLHNHTSNISQHQLDTVLRRGRDFS